SRWASSSAMSGRSRRCSSPSCCSASPTRRSSPPCRGRSATDAVRPFLEMPMTDHVAPRALLGVLTPSSNTVLEPLTCAILAGLPDVTAHFARFPVREISLRQEALGQFDEAPILEAARLLADARMQTILWSGTSSGWL